MRFLANPMFSAAFVGSAGLLLSLSLLELLECGRTPESAALWSIIPTFIICFPFAVWMSNPKKWPST